MGAITQAMAAAARQFGAEIRTSAPVERIAVSGGRARGVVLEDGTEIAAKVVVSNADPKRTFLGLVGRSELPEEFRRAVAGIKMDGPCAKVNFVLSEEPRVAGHAARLHEAAARALHTRALPRVRRALLRHRPLGRNPRGALGGLRRGLERGPDLAPEGRHVMTCFVQYVPYRLKEGTWDEKRELLGDRVVRKIGEYAPNVPGAVVARQVLTPLDLERTYGLTEGNIFHGDLSLEQLFFLRPVAGFARYRTPIDGLYLCGAGAHPGGGVTGAPGHNASRQVLRDWKRRVA